LRYVVDSGFAKFSGSLTDPAHDLARLSCADVTMRR